MRPVMLLERLSTMAADRSGESRIALLREITDLFMSDVATRSSRELDLFDDVMSRIAEDVTEVARAELADRIATVERPPRGLIARLARDAIGVARAVLQRSPALSDDDLVGIATTHGEGHRFAIAERVVLSERVTDVLIERGAEPTLSRIAENRGARFSAAGYSSLVDRAIQDDELQMRIAMREDLDEDTLAYLVRCLSAKVTERLRTSGLEGGRPASAQLLARLREKLAGADGELREVHELAASVRNGSMTLPLVVARLTKARRSYDLGILFGLLANLPQGVAVRAMQRKQNEPVLIICRALSLPWPSVDAVLAMKAIKCGENYRPSLNTQRSYESLTSESAERAMRLLKVRSEAAEAA